MCFCVWIANPCLNEIFTLIFVCLMMDYINILFNDILFNILWLFQTFQAPKSNEFSYHGDIQTLVFPAFLTYSNISTSFCSSQYIQICRKLFYPLIIYFCDAGMKNSASAFPELAFLYRAVRMSAVPNKITRSDKQTATAKIDPSNTSIRIVAFKRTLHFINA